MGFDNECILNIQSLAGEYFCPVCRLLVYPNEALQSQCTHLYCKPCLAYVVGTTRACPYDGYLVTEADSKPLTESNKALAETIGKISVNCLYHRSGCTWQGPLSDCTSHCSGCAFGNSPVVCNRCAIQIVHSQVQEHAQNCPGVQSQTQPAEGVHEAAATGVTVSTDQNQSATQVGTTTSQAQTSQTTITTTPAQDPNQQANPNPQTQAVQAAVPTPEQYQQQQYQQYYQQYPGYDPYQQQYQQYYPYQQQAVQQYQQHPANVPVPHTAQAFVQSQSHPQAQPQPLPQAQPQPHPHVQVPASAQHQNHQVNPLQQVLPAAHPHSQIHPQIHPPAHGNPPPQLQLYPQPQPHLQSQPMQPPPQSYPMQPDSQKVSQIPQYQQPHSQMQQPQPQIQPQPHPIPQPTPHSQAQPQPQLQHHPQPQPQLHPSQPNQPPHNVQPQVQHQSAHAVSSHQSYQQPQPQHQMPLIAPQQNSMVMHPQSGPNQQPQHPVQMQTQFPQQPAQMRPPQSHAPIPNQLPPDLLSMPGQGATIPSAQQQQIHPHAHQPGHPVHHRPVMLPNQQPMPHQYVQQQQFPFPGQPTGSVQNQLHQQGAFYHHQQQLPMQSQPRPQAPGSLPVAFSHVTQPYQSQNHAGRPMFPNNGVQSRPFPQSPGGPAGASQVKPMQLGANQQSMSQNYPIRTKNQSQVLSEQQLGHMQHLSHSQTRHDHLSEKNEGPSGKTAKNDANNVIASGSGNDSVEIKTVKYENDMNPTNIEDEKVTALENKDYVIKHVVKEEAIEGTLEPSAGGNSTGYVGEDQKDVTNISPIQVEPQSLKEKGSQEQAENLEEQSRKLHKDPLDNGGIVQPSRGDDKNTKAVPAALTLGSDSSQIPGKKLPQSLVSRGFGVIEPRGFLPPSQVQGIGSVELSHPVPITDHGRHQPPPTHYGPSAPSLVHAVPPGLPHYGQGTGLPPAQLRPQGPGNLGQTGQPLNHPDHFHPIGRGPSHSGPPQRSFELQSVAPQEFYNQSRMTPSHAGAPRTSHGESFGGPLLGVLPPAPFDAHGGMMARVLPLGPEGPIGLQRPNPLDAEMFLSQRRGYLDGRQPDLPSMARFNGPPGLESSYGSGMHDDRFKPLPREHMNSFPMEPSRHMIERGEFEDDLKQFPRPSHLDADPKFGGYPFASRPVDNKGPQAFGMDAIPSASAAPSRNLPFLRPNDTGERSRPVGFHEDNMGRPEFSHVRSDFLGPVSRYGRHHMDGSPVREYPGLPSRGSGPGVHGVQSGLDIDGRESLRFGDGSKPFNLHSDPIGSFHETRFPMPPHLRRGELEGPFSSRISEVIGQDILPSHLHRDDPLGPRNLPSHLRLGEPGFGRPFSGHARIGELAGPGNFPPRFGEPGFRSSYPLQDSGFYKGNMESFDNPRKRKPTSMGWCRICKVDCETMECLDLHSQTREHQEMAMDMVLNIKQQNAKKKKLISNDHSTAEDASKSKSASFESHRIRH